jgi:hypothetical protein
MDIPKNCSNEIGSRNNTKPPNRMQTIFKCPITLYLQKHFFFLKQKHPKSLLSTYVTADVVPIIQYDDKLTKKATTPDTKTQNFKKTPKK